MVLGYYVMNWAIERYVAPWMASRNRGCAMVADACIGTTTLTPSPAVSSSPMQRNSRVLLERAASSWNGIRVVSSYTGRVYQLDRE